jgi:hypothetical protein
MAELRETPIQAKGRTASSKIIIDEQFSYGLFEQRWKGSRVRVRDLLVCMLGVGISADAKRSDGGRGLRTAGPPLSFTAVESGSATSWQTNDD